MYKTTFFTKHFGETVSGQGPKDIKFFCNPKKLISTKYVIRRNIYFAGNNDSVGIIFE